MTQGRIQPLEPPAARWSSEMEFKRGEDSSLDSDHGPPTARGWRAPFARAPS